MHNQSVSQQQQQPFYGPLSGTTRVSRYQKKHSPTHHPAHHPVFISFFHLPRSIASSLFKLHAWQFFCTISFHVLFGLPLGLEPSTSYSILFFTQSVSSFCSTCPYHRNLVCSSISIISSIPSLSLNSLRGTLYFTLTLHIRLTISQSISRLQIYITPYVESESQWVNNLPTVITQLLSEQEWIASPTPLFQHKTCYSST